jgi:anhydro-N-acetylmuramic acid kinase
MISGTSRDGVDAALIRFEDDKPRICHTSCIPYPTELADSLDTLLLNERRPQQEELDRLDPLISRHFSDTALALMTGADVKPAQIRAIGSHGQTVWHEPDGPRPVSIQLGNPQLIAQASGIVTVGDFRRADIESGGQGAPLAPLLHRALFQPEKGRRVVLNLGGIANISILGDKGSVSGFDTGPANCLLDAWVRKCKGALFDTDGAWADSGTADPTLLEDMTKDDYFEKPAPKSTGTEYFNIFWLERYIQNYNLSAADIQATLAELTALTVAKAIEPFGPADVIVCGGGIHNGYLMRRIEAHLQGITVRSTAEAGLDPDWVEAVLFAWLARERLAGRAQDTRLITGAKRPVLLGTIAEPA